jgi:hypothetical protein
VENRHEEDAAVGDEVAEKAHQHGSGHVTCEIIPIPPNSQKKSLLSGRGLDKQGHATPSSQIDGPASGKSRVGETL